MGVTGLGVRERLGVSGLEIRGWTGLKLSYEINNDF